jgi:hypothetical protein
MRLAVALAMTDADQFFCTRHPTPAALSFEHNSVA